MYTKPRAESVDLEPSPKTGSDKINMLRQKKRTQEERSCITQPGLTKHNLALREVDLEASATRTNDKTKALVNLYSPSQTVPLKQTFSRISYKSTLVDP